MVLTEQRRYGSFDLNATNGIIITKIDGQLMNAVDFEGRNDGIGSLRTRDAIEGVEVNMDGEITANADSSILRSRVDAFMAALRNREDYLSIFDDRRILCGASSSIDTKFTEGTGYSRVKWGATFTSRYPSWESTTLSTNLIQLAPASSARGNMPANAGEAPAYPQISILNQGAAFSSARQVTLTNVSTGAQFRIDGLTLASGQTLVVDMRERRLGDGISIPTMPSGISGEWWELSPSSTQQLEIVVSGAAVSIDVTTSFRAQYWAA